ncbi:MAG: hydrogenase maturation protease [Proteobacteria bacterium]|nr:hydrogenase maturation protease [Pseudomonadota bacterium]
MKPCAIAASRRCETTTPASPAPRISCGWRSIVADAPPRRARRAIVVGIGNPDRGDDGAGRAVVQRLRGKLPAHIEAAEHDGEATSLLALLDGADAAFLIDACLSGAEPGTVRRFDVARSPLPKEDFQVSTHGLGLAEAIELARALKQLPSSCVVYAIEAASAEPGASLSPPVASAVDIVGEKVQAEITLAEGIRHA